MVLMIEEVCKIVELVCFEFVSDEEEFFVRQLGDVVDYIDQFVSFEMIFEDEVDVLFVEVEDCVGFFFWLKICL